MTQEEMEQIKLLIPEILNNATYNKSYYLQADSVCKQMNPTELRTKEVKRIRLCLAGLIRTNYQTREFAEKIRASLRYGHNFNMKKNMQDMVFCLLQAEKARQELFADKSFINHIEPRIPKFCRQYMNNIRNQEIADLLRDITQTTQASNDLLVDQL